VGSGVGLDLTTDIGLNGFLSIRISFRHVPIKDMSERAMSTQQLDIHRI